MMNSGKLSTDLKGGGDLRARPDRAVEPGAGRSNDLSGENRDLNQEGRQFSELLHRSSPPPLPAGAREGEFITDGSTETPSPFAATDAVEPPRRFAPHFLTQGGGKFDPPLCKRRVRGDSGPITNAKSHPPALYEREEVSVAGILIDNTNTTQSKRTNVRAKPPVADPILNTPVLFIAERGPPKLLNAPAPWQADPPSVASQKTLQSDDATNTDFKPLLPSGDQILQGLLGLPTVPTAPSETAPSDSGGDRLDRIEQLADRLAQRILVTDRAHITDSEVRIQLRESVLQGAEITIRRDEGQLVVNFNVVAAHIAQRLSPQTDDLQRALAARLETSVRIEISVSSPDAGSQSGSGDGRSRNRRDPREEWETRY